MTMPISLCLILLEVYFNWPLESLKSDNKWASYAKILKLVEIGKTKQGVPVHIGFWKGVPVHIQGVPVHVPRECPECVFSPLFHALSSIDHS